MSSLFSKPKSPPVQKVQSPPALPQTGPEVEDFAMREAKRRSGYQKTIVTGALEPVKSQKKTVLG